MNNDWSKTCSLYIFLLLWISWVALALAPKSLLANQFYQFCLFKLETSVGSRYYSDLVFNTDREEKISSQFLALSFLTPRYVSFFFLLVIGVSFPSVQIGANAGTVWRRGRLEWGGGRGVRWSQEEEGGGGSCCKWDPVKVMIRLMVIMLARMRRSLARLGTNKRRDCGCDCEGDDDDQSWLISIMLTSMSIMKKKEEENPAASETLWHDGDVNNVGNCDVVGDGDDNVDDGEEEGPPHWLC